MTSINYDFDNPKHQELVRKYSDVIIDLNKNIKADFDKDLQPKEIMGLFVNSVGNEKAVKHFNFLKIAHKQTGLSSFNEDDWKNVYLKYCLPIHKDNFQIESENKIFSRKYINKINHFMKLNHKEIIVLSIILGTIIGLIIGYIFGEAYYYLPNGKRINHQNDNTIEVFRFNYATSLATFIITSGISYLVLNKMRKD